MKNSIKLTSITIVIFILGSFISCIFSPLRKEIIYYDIEGFYITMSEKVNSSYPSCQWFGKPILDSVKYEKFCIILKDYDNPSYNSANAELWPRGNIKEINVYSDKRYDKNHDKSESLNDIFSACITGEGEISVNLIDIPIIKPRCGRLIQLNIDMPPDSVRSHIFTIQYNETDDTYFEYKTEPVRICK